MACVMMEHKRVFFILWGKPEKEDMKPFAERMRVLHEKVGPFVFVARVPAGAEAPGEAERKEITRIIREFGPAWASYHAVMEGTGFAVAAKRAVLASLFLMSTHRGKFHVHSRIQDVHQAVPLDLRDEVSSALRHFEPLGLLKHNLRSIRPPSGLAIAQRRAQ
jgi:hypothetical protein